MSIFSIFGSAISSINLHPCHFKIFTLTLDFTSHCDHLHVSALYNIVYMYLMLVIPNVFFLTYLIPYLSIQRGCFPVAGTIKL